MIIDCFTFFNELDLLEIRLHTLDSVVDYFVIVEANKTQTLKDKPFYFEDNMARFSEFLPKIIYVKVENCPKENDHLWKMENFQRNQIKVGLERLNLSINDKIMISDLDEIPNPEVVRAIAEKEDIHILAFDMSFHAYYANLVSPNKGWIGTVLLKNEVLQAIEPQDVRNIKDKAPRVVNAGWHLSWLGGIDKVYEKLHSCIEPFDKSTVPTKEEFKAIFEERVKKTGQFHLINKDDDTVPLEIVGDEVLPKHLVINKEEYSHLFI